MPGRDKETSQQGARGRRKNYGFLFFMLLFILTATLALVLYFLFFKNSDDNVVGDAEGGAAETIEVAEEPEVPAVDLQPVVDEWVKSVPYGNKSVLIYDLERGEKAAEYDATEGYNTASLYKIFVVYEGYRRLQSGEWDGEEQAGATGYTVRECLDLAIRESDSLCAESLWAKIGRDKLERIVEQDFEITNSDILDLISNPEDIAKMMRIFYEHTDITDEELIAAMKDSFLNQPPTEYDWRQGLPSGFSDATNVYNKVGWDYNADGGYWNIYHDAAIVEFPELDRHFIVVVMTNRVDFKDIARLGGEIEKKVVGK